MTITKSTVFKTLNDLKKVNPGLVERFKEYMEGRKEPADDATMVVVRPPHIAHYLLGTEEAMYYYFDSETGYAVQETRGFSWGID